MRSLSLSLSLSRTHVLYHLNILNISKYMTFKPITRVVLSYINLATVLTLYIQGSEWRLVILRTVYILLTSRQNSDEMKVCWKRMTKHFLRLWRPYEANWKKYKCRSRTIAALSLPNLGADLINKFFSFKRLN